MACVIDDDLKMMIQMQLMLELEDTVYNMLDACKKGEEEATNKYLEEYNKLNRLIELGYEMIIDGKLKKWDWKWLYEGGKLSQMDWLWFGKDLKESGLSEEEYYKK